MTRTNCRADLHTHSTASDGELSPAELVIEASEQGISVLALTDHDTTAGLAEAEVAARRMGLHFIPGLEISADVPTGEMHMLGYGVHSDDADLQSNLESFRGLSADRLRRMLTLLRDQGIDIDESALARDGDEDSVGRPHVARAMVAAGYSASVSDAFRDYLSEGSPAYVRKDKMKPLAAVQLVRRAGGLPILAHPYSVPELESRLSDLVDAGLAGLECFYGEYNAKQRQRLASMADSLGLIATGGSDFHGDVERPARALGSVDFPLDRLNRFLETYENRPR